MNSKHSKTVSILVIVLSLVLSANTFIVVSGQHHYEEIDKNCLRDNPNILDGGFIVFYRRNRLVNITEDDVADIFALFSTRFNRAHELQFLSPDEIKTVGNGVKKFLMSSKGKGKGSAELFVASELSQDESNIDEVIRVYNNSYNAVLEVNNGGGGGSRPNIAGLYLGFPSGTIAVKLEAIETVFGNKSSSQLPIGVYSYDCERIFQGDDDIKVVNYLQRLNFITCNIEVDFSLSSPEFAANETVTKCMELQTIASTNNIDAGIMCRPKIVSHEPGTLNEKGLEAPASSVSQHSRFWCSVIDAIKQGHYLSPPRIIMGETFDYVPPIGTGETEKDNYNNVTTIEYQPGWWKRVHESSSHEPDTNAEEKINDEGIVLPLQSKIRQLFNLIEEMNSTLSRYVA